MHHVSGNIKEKENDFCQCARQCLKPRVISLIVCHLGWVVYESLLTSCVPVSALSHDMTLTKLKSNRVTVL